MKKLINYYYDLFDNKISDTSMVVWIIWILIFIVWIIAPVKTYSTINFKSNLAEINNSKINIDFSSWDYIFLNWTKYYLSTSKQN